MTIYRVVEKPKDKKKTRACRGARLSDSLRAAGWVLDQIKRAGEIRRHVEGRAE